MALEHNISVFVKFFVFCFGYERVILCFKA